MRQKQNNIPKLRFPEFSGKWEEIKLGKICSKVGSGSTPLGGEDVYSKTGIPFIRSQNVINNSLVLDDTCISKEINAKMKGSIVKANDILLNITGGSIGRSCVVPNDFVEGNVNQHVSIIRLEKDIPKFIQSFLNSYKGQKLILRGQTGSGREGLNFQSIRGFKLNLPGIPEQQKIASFLSSVDKKIELLTKKKTLLEDYKKGGMQKIFRQELRFKDENGNNYPDWEEKALGEIFQFKQGVQCGVENQFAEKGEEMVRFIRIIDLTSLNEPMRYIESVGEEHIIKKDDLFMVRYGTPGLVGYGFEGTIANNLFRLIPKVTLNTKFYFYVFNLLGNKLKTLSNSSTMPALNFRSMETINIPVLSLKEQTKIANFLSAIDKKIALVAEALEATNTFKKGLLQQMFV